jgi:hypothetical protein
MRLVGGSHYFVWGTMAALLYAGPASPRPVGVNNLEAQPALALSDAALPDADQRATLADPDPNPALADPVAPTEPEEVRSLEGQVPRLHRPIPVVDV